MPNLNICQFIGHLGKDPEMRYTPSGKAPQIRQVAEGHSARDRGCSSLRWLKQWSFGREASTPTKGIAIIVL